MSKTANDLGDPWPPRRDHDGWPQCDKCDTRVSPEFYRQWADNDGTLYGCRHCLPRSIRFGEDVYDRDPEEVTDFDLEAPNRGRDPAPSSRVKDQLEATEEDGDETDDDQDGE